MFHTSYGRASLMLVMTHEVEGVAQGGVVRFPVRFDSGVMRRCSEVYEVPLPEMSRERRQEFVKTAHKLAEEGRVHVRNVRRDAIGVTGKPFILAAGADLTSIQSGGPDAVRTIAQLGHAVFRKLGEGGKPSFGFINGLALGGGLEIALAANRRIAITVLTRQAGHHGIRLLPLAELPSAADRRLWRPDPCAALRSGG